MGDHSKELLEALYVASQPLIGSDDDKTINSKEFCHTVSIDDVSAFEDALQHCNTHFLTLTRSQSQHLRQAGAAGAGDAAAAAAVTQTYSRGRQSTGAEEYVMESHVQYPHTEWICQTILRSCGRSLLLVSGWIQHGSTNCQSNTVE
jgi:hypothetical protein